MSICIQILKDQTIYFNDREQARKALSLKTDFI